ncbi:hypothetical protein PVAP13_1KG068500 [Panicum virgatum]|uniref:Uncharacterized protein n=1 Tax=Panicum virgatum TaxID=38727 RepID=A0A8T0XL89_PANVG|nr:hypothetical protein PVAP13_1KG068500 [Panicum virgatum]
MKDLETAFGRPDQNPTVEEKRTTWPNDIYAGTWSRIRIPYIYTVYIIIIIVVVIIIIIIEEEEDDDDGSLFVWQAGENDLVARCLGGEEVHSLPELLAHLLKQKIEPMPTKGTMALN